MLQPVILNKSNSTLLYRQSPPRDFGKVKHTPQFIDKIIFTVSNFKSTTGSLEETGCQTVKHNDFYWL